jgi:signal transduction histidine kinase
MLHSPKSDLKQKSTQNGVAKVQVKKPKEPTQPKKIIWRPSIRFYLVLMNLILLCLLFPGASLLYLHQEAQSRDVQLHRAIEQMRQALESRTAALMRNMALSAGYAVAGFDFTFLNNMVRQAVAEDPEIRYCLIMDAKGRAVAHSDPEKVGTTLTGPRDRKAAAMLASVFPSTISENQRPQVDFIDGALDPDLDEPQVMEALTPIYSGAKLYAVLRCGISLGRLSTEIRTTRQNWTQRSRQFKIYLASTTGLFFTLGMLIAALFTRSFVRSIKGVIAGVSRVSHGDLDHQIQPEGLICAELLNLAEAFNAMTEQLKVSRKMVDEYNKSLENKVAERTKELKDAQANLMQQAHEAGMAEMAVGILHNIGNAITPAKVGLFQLFHRMRKKPLMDSLPTALEEISGILPASPPGPDRDRLLRILELTPSAINEEYERYAGEIEQIQHKLVHIEGIIGLQMRYAQIFGEQESVDVSQVVEDALTLLDDSLQKRNVQVAKNFSSVPPVRIEKTQLMQIIINLIKNSCEAMDEVTVQERTLTLSIRRDPGPPDYLTLSVKDNGIGFSPDEQEQIFKFGYTTKARGSGFGLHSCANYLIAHNGAIHAHSNGRGKGAEFVVQLAINAPNTFHEGG